MVIRQKKIKVQKRIKGGREEDRGREVERPQREMEKKRNVSRLPRGNDSMRLCLSISATLPAHHTSHLQSLDYHFLAHSFLLVQRQDSKSTGTALWLGAQCLSAYLATVHNSISHSHHTRPRVLELGSGTGLAAFVLSVFL